MICPKCHQEGIAGIDYFCRHCGLSVVKEKVTVKHGAPGLGLEFMGVAIVGVLTLIIVSIASAMGWVEFGASALPFLLGGAMFAGLMLMLMGGLEYIRTH